MLLVQKHGELRSDTFPLRSYRLLEKMMLNVIRETAPNPDHRFAEGARKLFRSVGADHIHGQGSSAGMTEGNLPGTLRFPGQVGLPNKGSHGETRLSSKNY
jgi:hypothetical protein